MRTRYASAWRVFSREASSRRHFSALSIPATVDASRSSRLLLLLPVSPPPPPWLFVAAAASPADFCLEELRLRLNPCATVTLCSWRRDDDVEDEADDDEVGAGDDEEDKGGEDEKEDAA
eukprot:CAMPEP_0171937256 /NCGR_PEP_ID=MMETSP0993-20121228/34468_1 /TAXON_ID=483369 /ORGANISM="non described non described, Strain CCMP2098" /LENGTH=118 /DNA_ID=CAMNT_0012578589 /DNA_START=199 /DNA_END=551 /DNA_ORIENTATION=+